MFLESLGSREVPTGDNPCVECTSAEPERYQQQTKDCSWNRQILPWTDVSVHHQHGAARHCCDAEACQKGAAAGSTWGTRPAQSDTRRGEHHNDSANVDHTDDAADHRPRCYPVLIIQWLDSQVFGLLSGSEDVGDTRGAPWSLWDGFHVGFHLVSG